LSDRIVLYALGGGLGHAVRACRLAAALGDRGANTIVLLPEDKSWVAGTHHVEHIALERQRRPADLRRLLDAHLRGSRATHFVVDVFARGVLGELVPVPRDVETILLLRAHRAEKLASLVPALAAYDRVIDVESSLDWLRADRVEPTLPLARSVPQAEAVDVLLVAGGDPKLRAFLERLGSRLKALGARTALVEPGRERLPALSAYSPRLVVGAAGYNLTYECATAGVWHLAVPLPRPIDDQRLRARTVAEAPRDPVSLERRALALLESDDARPPVSTGTYETLADRITRPPATSALPRRLVR
jgi:hypothetical protein